MQFLPTRFTSIQGTNGSQATSRNLPQAAPQARERAAYERERKANQLLLQRKMGRRENTHGCRRAFLCSSLPARGRGRRNARNSNTLPTGERTESCMCRPQRPPDCATVSDRHINSSPMTNTQSSGFHVVEINDNGARTIIYWIVGLLIFCNR